MITNKQAVTEKMNRFTSFPIGVTRGVSLDSAKIEVNSKGSNYAVLRFVQKEAKYGITKFIWLPDYSSKPRDGESKEKAKERIQNEFLRVCTEILMSFGLPENESTITGTDEVEFLQKFVDKCQKIKKEDMLCDLRVQMDQNDKYTELPRYNFIAPYVPGVTSQLERYVEKPKFPAGSSSYKI